MEKGARKVRWTEEDESRSCVRQFAKGPQPGHHRERSDNNTKLRNASIEQE